MFVLLDPVMPLKKIYSKDIIRLLKDLWTKISIVTLSVLAKNIYRYIKKCRLTIQKGIAK